MIFVFACILNQFIIIILLLLFIIRFIIQIRVVLFSTCHASSLDKPTLIILYHLTETDLNLYTFAEL